jgi:hypothetical protein
MWSHSLKYIRLANRLLVKVLSKIEIFKENELPIRQTVINFLVQEELLQIPAQ